MSEQGAKTDQFLEAPECVYQSEMEREEFLSQLGNFTPQERAIFHRVCKRWAPEIPYRSFLSALDIKNAAGDVGNLFKKLRTHRMGLITYKVEEGFRKPDKLVLTPPDGILFYTKTIDDYYIRLQETLSAPLPYASEVLSNLPAFPDYEMRTIEYLDLLRLIGSSASDGGYPTIYRIPVKDSDAVLATHVSVKWLIHAAVGKLRAFFSNPNYLEMAAKHMNTSLLEVKKLLETRNPDFWRNLTSTLLAAEQQIVGNRSIRVGKRFFQICDLICRYVESQLQVAEEERKEREDRELDMSSIAHAVRDDRRRLVPEADLTQLIESVREKYEHKFAGFKADFFTSYTQSQHSLPTLVNITKDYIHIDNLYVVFSGRMDAMRPLLQRHFTKVMERQLRTNNRSNDDVFFSKENFEQSILEAIRAEDDFLATSLERPNVISEAMVHHLKKRGKIKSPEDLRAHLMLFFHAKTLMFLPLAEIFNLNLGEIFHSGFIRLPLWRQILIRMLGRYTALEDKFIGRSFTSYKKTMKNELKDRREMLPHEAQRQDMQQMRGRKAKGRKAAGTTKNSSRSASKKSDKSPQAAARRRGYNTNEREQAWKRFGDTLKS